jgi:murein DD-endopeptidase MepM/ murein hydrolase activator NlpD
VAALSQEGVCVPETKNAKIYDCYIPIGSDTQANEYVLTIKATDAVGNVSTLEKTFQVVMYPFKKQRLNISSQAYQEQRNRGLSEQQLEEAIQHITSQSNAEKLWHGAFFVPCDMQGTSTEYGTLRTTQQRGKYRHDALDLLATPKSVIWACLDGNIALKNRYEHSGNTVIIDHGSGVLSLYFHLDEHADVEAGQSIKQGKPIGTLGKTGYASGYHLHWELRINNVAVDPMEWTKPGF